MNNRNIYFVHDDGSAELKCGEYIVLLDSRDVDKVSKFQWSVGTHGYATSGAGQKQQLLHRLIVNAQCNDIVDHINRNKLDNRRTNLRICTASQNAMNKCNSNGKNPYKGICQTSDGMWQAQIYYDHEAIYLGLFSDECKAAKAYDTAARELYGEYAYLNFPYNNEIVKTTVNHFRRLSWNEAEIIRGLYANGLTISQIAEIYEHSYSSIQRIVNYKTFTKKSVEDTYE